MNEKPILFSGPMVRALLEGRKTQTRRVVKLPESVTFLKPEFMQCGRWEFPSDSSSYRHQMDCPYGQPGDRLWVRETFYCDNDWYPEGQPDGITKIGPEGRSMTIEEKRSDMLECMDYRATHSCAAYESGCPCSDENGRSSWRPSIHMPRWASRINLEITGIRAERLNDISEEDANAEGAQWRAGDGLAWGWRHDGENDYVHDSAKASYQELWESINGAGSWALNPWVWVVEFKVAEGGSKA